MPLQTVLAQPLIWIAIAAYLLSIWPAGLLISRITRKWRERIDRELPRAGLPEAGRWIGYLERLIILTLVLYGEFSAIGFLVAAKSLLRFGELRGNQDKLQTEYVLVGTLLSFAIAMALGMLVQAAALFWPFAWP